MKQKQLKNISVVIGILFMLLVTLSILYYKKDTVNNGNVSKQINDALRIDYPMSEYIGDGKNLAVKFRYPSSWSIQFDDKFSNESGYYVTINMLDHTNNFNFYITLYQNKIKSVGDETTQGHPVSEVGNFVKSNIDIFDVYKNSNINKTFFVVKNHVKTGTTGLVYDGVNINEIDDVSNINVWCQNDQDKVFSSCLIGDAYLSMYYHISDIKIDNFWDSYYKVYVKQIIESIYI